MPSQQDVDLENYLRTLPLFTTLGETNAFSDMAHKLKQRYKKFLICGLGGSILTAKALLSLSRSVILDNPGYAKGLVVAKNVARDRGPMNCIKDVSEIQKERTSNRVGNGPSVSDCVLSEDDAEVTVLDSIDPLTLYRLQQQDLSDTCIIFISKSGETSEILCQVQALRPKEAIVITQTKPSPLLSIAQKNNWMIIPHPHDIGGRFSAFTAVGCLPCLLMGLDPNAFIEGAKAAIKDYQTSEAQTLFDAYQAGHTLHVLCGYSDYLDGLLAWCCQLIAESLGKKDNNQQSFGFQPIVNRGTLDQHSQLQLYLDGPHKYIFTLLRVNCDTIRLPSKNNIVSNSSMALYQNHTPYDFLKAHFENTKLVLEEAGHHVREIILPDLSEKSFGFVMMRFILETLSLASLAKVNPFDQPAVELSKRFMERFL